MLKFVAFLRSTDGDPSTYEMAVDAVDFDDAGIVAVQTATERYGASLYVVGLVQADQADYVADCLAEAIRIGACRRDFEATHPEAADRRAERRRIYGDVVSDLFADSQVTS